MQEGLDSDRHAEVLHNLVLDKLYQLRIAETAKALLQDSKRHHGLGHGAMAPGTAEVTKGMPHHLAGAFARDIITHRYDQIATKDS